MSQAGSLPTQIDDTSSCEQLCSDALVHPEVSPTQSEEASVSGMASCRDESTCQGGLTGSVACQPEKIVFPPDAFPSMESGLQPEGSSPQFEDNGENMLLAAEETHGDESQIAGSCKSSSRSQLQMTAMMRRQAMMPRHSSGRAPASEIVPLGSPKSPRALGGPSVAGAEPDKAPQSSTAVEVLSENQKVEGRISSFSIVLQMLRVAGGKSKLSLGDRRRLCAAYLHS